MATNYSGGGARQTGWGNDRQAVAQPTISVSDIKLQAPLSAEIFADVAKEKAAKIFEAKGGRKINESTQLRKFYDELVMWFDKVHHERTKIEKDGKYAEVAPFIKMLNAKVAYARGRSHVDECFEQMFSHLIRQITDPDSLKHAKLFMEAFMGFYKAQEK